MVEIEIHLRAAVNGDDNSDHFEREHMSASSVTTESAGYSHSASDPELALAQEVSPTAETPSSPPPESTTVHMPKVKRKPRAKPPVVQTSDPNVQVEVRKRKPGPRPKKVVVYEEDMPEKKIVIVKKSHKRGRPKESIKVEVPEFVEQDTKPKTSKRVKFEKDCIVIPRPEEGDKQPTQRELKRMELDARFAEMEAIAGKKLKQTVKGKVDGRCKAQRTDKQIAASQALVEHNRLRREQKKMQQNKELVTGVINELSKQEVEAPVQSQPLGDQETGMHVWKL